MARPVKNGIEYYPLNVDFLEDIKVRKIMRSEGAVTVAVLLDILGKIYKDEGYFLRYDEDVRFFISDFLGIEEEIVESVVLKAVEVGFFNKIIFEQKKILTSKGIQKRFLKAIERRVNSNILEEIDISTDEKLIEFEKNNKIENEEIEENKEVKKEKSSIDKNDIEKIKNKWNEIDNLTKLIAVKTGTTRHKLLKARLNEYGLEDVLKCIEEVNKSDFLKGYKDSKGWKCSFDWLIKPTNFLKVLEGKYRNEEAECGRNKEKFERNTEETKIKILDFSK